MAPPQPLPRYDISQSYHWNYDHAPLPPEDVAVPDVAGKWTYCGVPVPSPLAIAAGPLLNSRWILYYAALGFDILTYKTARSRARDCYPLPNLQPVDASLIERSGNVQKAIEQMQGSWAVSFGMPSMSSDVWRADIEWTKCHLPKDKLLSVSVVASPEPDWSLDQLADDFALCAGWAIEGGADCVEANFSCPNVSSADGQLYQQPESAAIVATRIRQAIGTTPLILKVGYFDDKSDCGPLLDAIAPFTDALAMTNCISAAVERPSGEKLFAGQSRGIGGDAIRAASVNQTRVFSELVRKRGYATKIIGVGGISTAEHVRAYLDAGAESIQLATAAMLDPLVGITIRQKFSSNAQTASYQA
jgi:dihydroorotate dehydrogenase (NAD+) catalytic subunit